jgi:DUF2934 family protein
MAKSRKKSGDSEAASADTAGDTTTAVVDRDRIALRAYELYVERGCGEGREMDDWLDAERELTNGRRSNEES